MMLLLPQAGVPGTADAAELVKQFGLAQGLLIAVVCFLMMMLGWLIWDFKRANNKQSDLLVKAVTLLEILVDRKAEKQGR